MFSIDPIRITGLHAEGPVLESEFASFVGMHPIPVRHAMTIGELARLFNGQHWLADGVQANLVVVPMQDWRRGLWYDQTNLVFRKPSPNIPDIETAIVYPGLCLFEGTNVSEGRGTSRPFRQFGAPWFDAAKLAQRLNNLNLVGVRFAPTRFTPTASKHAGVECHGVELTVTDRERFEPFFCGVSIVREVCQVYPDQFEWRAAHFDRLCGTSAVREAMVAGESVAMLREKWRAGCAVLRRSASLICCTLVRVCGIRLRRKTISAIFCRAGRTVPLSSGCARLVRMIRYVCEAGSQTRLVPVYPL